MGELKPLGSEKLAADAKLKRILELTYFQSSGDSKKSTEVVKESKTGVYGIVKEKDGYYVKKGSNENSLDYIGGMFMKNKNRFSAYGEALKKLEFLVEQESLQEATKYVLKTPKPQQEAPIPEPTGEMPPPPAAPEGAMPPAAPDAGEELPPEDGMPPEGEEDFLKVIQKLSGKLQQKLMAYKDKLESKDIKAAIMQVLSGVDLDKQLDESDKEEILGEFEPQEDVPGEEIPGEEVPSETDTAAPPAEDELGEIDGMAALEELITHPFEDEGGYEDDEDIPEPLDFEDSKATGAAQYDVSKEFPDEEDDDEIEGTTDEFNPEEEEDEQMEPSYTEPTSPVDTNLATPSSVDSVKELDITELSDMVNTSVKETLSKYFES